MGTHDFEVPELDENIVDITAQVIFRALDGSVWEGAGEASQERYRDAARIVAPELPAVPERPEG